MRVGIAVVFGVGTLGWIFVQSEEFEGVAACRVDSWIELSL